MRGIGDGTWEVYPAAGRLHQPEPSMSTLGPKQRESAHIDVLSAQLTCCRAIVILRQTHSNPHASDPVWCECLCWAVTLPRSHI